MKVSGLIKSVYFGFVPRYYGKKSGGNMKKIIIFILLSLSLFAISKEKKETVLKDFNSFKNNYGNRNAEETIKYFTPNSIKMYDDLLEVAINGAGDKKIGFLESMVIMNLQSKLSIEEMKKMTGRDIMIWSINEGIDNFENFNSLPVYDVYEQEGDSYVVVGYEKENIPIKLEYSDKLWKVDFPYLYEFLNKTFENFFGASGISEKMFLENAEEAVYDDSYYEDKRQAPRNKKVNR